MIRPLATSGRGSGVVGSNVQAAVETEQHLIITHDVIPSGSDQAPLAPMANKTEEVLGVDQLDVVADRGYFSSEQILECSQADVTVMLPKPMTTGVNANGQFGEPSPHHCQTQEQAQSLEVISECLHLNGVSRPSSKRLVGTH